MDPDTQTDFWNFSFEQVSIYDMKSVVDFILKTRQNKSKIIAIGHSQGTLISAMSFALEPEYYKQRFSLFLAINPTIEFKYLSE